MLQDHVPFLELRKINKPFIPEIRRRFDDIIENSHFLLGKYVSQFEENFAAACTTGFAVGVNSGLDAMSILLKSLIYRGDLSVGDTVAVPANTFIATFLSAIEAGLEPIPVDVNPETHCIDSNLLLKSYKKNRFRAVIIVHLYGYVSDMHAIEEICQDEGILLIEDAAQAHLANVDGRPVGAWGVGGAFSFYPGKNLGAFGDAGAITTSSEDIAEICKSIRNYGSKHKYEHEIIGENSRMDELQAAVLDVKLAGINEEIIARRTVAKRYLEEIENQIIKLPDYVRSLDENMVFHQFVIRVSQREKFISYMENNGVGVQIHYPTPAYKQVCFNGRFNSYICPETDRLASEVVSLPINSALTDNQISKVIEVCNNAKI